MELIIPCGPANDPLHKPKFCKYTNFMVPIRRFLWITTEKQGLKSWILVFGGITAQPR